MSKRASKCASGQPGELAAATAGQAVGRADKRSGGGMGGQACTAGMLANKRMIQTRRRGGCVCVWRALQEAGGRADGASVTGRMA